MNNLHKKTFSNEILPFLDQKIPSGGILFKAWLASVPKRLRQQVRDAVSEPGLGCLISIHDYDEYIRLAMANDRNGLKH